MNTSDFTTFNQAVQLAQNGYKQAAYQQLKALVWVNNNDLEANLLLWLAFTSPSLEESEWAIKAAAKADFTNPNLASAYQWLETERSQRQQLPPTTPTRTAVPTLTFSTNSRPRKSRPAFLLVAGATVILLVLGTLVWFFSFMPKPLLAPATDNNVSQADAAKLTTPSAAPSPTLAPSQTTLPTTVAVPTSTATRTPEPTLTTIPGPTPTSTLLPSLRTAATANASTTLPPITPLGTDPLSIALKDANDTALLKGDFKTGLSKFKELTTRYPETAKIWRDYGFFLLLKDLDTNSIEPLEKAAKLDKSDPLTFLYLGIAYAQNSRVKEALDAFKTANQLDAKGWLGQLSLAAFYVWNFQFDLVATPVAAAQKAARSSGATNEPVYNYLLATVAFFVPDTKTSNEAIAIAASIWSRVPSIMIAKASHDFLFNSKDETAKKAILDTITEAALIQPNAYFVQAFAADYAYYIAQDEKSALSFAQQALKLHEATPTVHRLLGSILVSKKDYQEAFTHFERCVELAQHMLDCYSNWSDALIDYGRQLRKQGQEAEAKQAFQKAQATALEIYNRLPKVKNVYSGWSADFNFLMGQACYYQEEFPTAISNFQKALNYYSQNAELYGWLGLAYLKDNQKDKAREAYKRGSAISPNDPIIQGLGNQLNAGPGDDPII